MARYCKICEQEVEALKDHLAEVHDLSVRAYNALVQCKVCGQWLKQVNAQHMATHDMSMTDYDLYDPTPPFMADRIETFYRIHDEPEPAPPEPTVTVRLAKCESNPFSCSVEGRPHAVYHFQQPIKDKPGWQNLPASDAWILLGSEDGSVPPKYPHLKFERKRR